MSGECEEAAYSLLIIRSYVTNEQLVMFTSPFMVHYRSASLAYENTIHGMFSKPRIVFPNTFYLPVLKPG